MDDASVNKTSQQNIDSLRQEIEETYRGVLELVYEMAEPEGIVEVNRLKQEIEKLSTELEETYRGVIELATNLKQDEQKIQTLTAGSELGLWEWSTTDNTLQVNDEWLAITGLSHEEFGNRLADWDRLIHPDDLLRVQHERRKFLKGGRLFCRSEYRIRSAGNGWIWVLSSAKQVSSDIKVKPRAVAGTLLNINTRKQGELKIQQLNTELEQFNWERTREIERINHQLLEEVREHQRTVQALRQANRQADEANREIRLLSDRLALAVDSAQIGIWDWDIEQNHIHWDSKMYSIYGLEKTEYNNTYQAWQKFIHPDDLTDTLGAVQDAIKNNSDLDTEFRIVWRDGSIHHIKANARIQQNESGSATRMIGMNYDITLNKQMETELLQAKHTADTANQAKSVFLANMSHELRTPLQSILGFSQLMQHDPDLSSQQIKNLETINRSGTHLYELINDVLEISEIESGRVIQRPVEFNIYDLLHEIESLFKLQIEKKNIYLNIAIATNIPTYVKADVVKLRQILFNLVGNAVKFTDTGGINLRLNMASRSRQIQFEIEDTGPGISRGELKRLFQPFEQGLAGIAKGGTGLGLMISREYISLLDGELSVNSTPGKGSCFSFKLPFQTVGQKLQVVNTSTQVATGLKSGKGSRLAMVLEHHKHNLLFIVQFLNKIGFQTIAASAGTSLFKQLKSNQPDVILLGLNLEDFDCYELIRKIRKSKPGSNVPIIAVTANTFDNTINKVRAAGANDLLIKPFSLADMTNILAKLPHIDLLFEDENNSHSNPDIPQEPDTAGLSMLPDELRLKLRTAAENGDINKLRYHVGDIDQLDHELASYMGQLVEYFDYDKILKILN